MSTEMDSTQERFETFLRTYKDDMGNEIYRERIQLMQTNEETSLFVDFEDLFNYDIALQEDVSDDPLLFLEAASNALRAILRSYQMDEYISYVGEDAIKVRFVNYTREVKLRHIRSKHIGKLIRIGGIMMRASEVKPLLVSARFLCRVCMTEIPQEQEEGRYTEPPLCPTCGKKTPMRLMLERSRFVDWQKVRIQESPEELPPGQMPRSVDVVLKGDIVDMSRPGDLVKVTGILQTSPDFSRRGGKLATFSIFIEANGVEIAEKEYEQVEITKEEMKQIKELAEDPYVHQRIFRSIAPSIKGHDHIKESIALMLFGGYDKELADKTKLRGRSNILMIGDPGTGKSQILKFVTRLANRALYTSGKGTTAAGLTAAVVHDTETGAMTLEAGALVLADQGIACIDEFDKMDPNDRTAIHEAMEQHTVSIAKAGIIATLNARTSILAAANPTLGRYESSLSVQDNIKLPFTILSRFDLIWIMVDTVEETRDREIAKFILDMHQMKPVHAEEDIAPLDADFLRKYIIYAGEIKPLLSAEAAEVIEKFYVDLRKSAEGGAAPVPITARQLESLVRLSEARAKMALRSRVTKEDAQAALRLMEESLRMVALDRITGKIDIDSLVSSQTKSQRSISDSIIKALRDLESEGSSTVDEDVLIQRTIAMGHARDRVEEMIKKLQADGILYSPRDGKIRHSQS